MSSAPRKAGKVYLVGAGPGDPGLLTIKGAECLRRADVVVYDRLGTSAELLALAPESAERVFMGKEPETPEEQALLEALTPHLDGEKRYGLLQVVGPGAEGDACTAASTPTDSSR